MSDDKTATSEHDQAEIRNVIARLAHATDIGTVEEYLERFTDDAVLTLPGQPPREGRHGLELAAHASRKAGTLGPGTHTAHHVSTFDVEIQGDTATSKATFIFLGDTDSSPVIRSAGRYNDVLQRTSLGWKLVRRTVDVG